MNIGIILPYRVTDAILATSALKTLRQHSPTTTRVVGLMTPAVAEFLEGNPWLEETRLLDSRSPKQARRSLAVIQQLRQESWDEWLVLSDRLPDRLIPWLATARAFSWFKFWGQGSVGRSPLGESVDPFGTFGDLLQTLGCDLPNGRPQLTTTAADEAQLDAYLQAQGVAQGQRFAVVSNGAVNRSAESWPTDYFAILSRRLVAELGFDVVACQPAGSPGNESAIVERANDPRVRTGLPVGGSWKALVRRAAVVITTDPLMRLLAAAFQTPNIMLFGPQDMRFDTPSNPHEIQLQLPLACSPCGRTTCPLGHLRCLRDLTPNEVFFAVRRHLGNFPERIAA